MVRLLVIFLLFVLVILSYGLTEKEVLYKALSNNTNIKIARINLKTDSLDFENIKVGRLPLLTLSGDPAYKDNSRSSFGDTSIAISSGFDAHVRKDILGGGVLQAQSGQTVELNLETAAKKFATNISLDYMQPLLKNARGYAQLDYTIALKKNTTRQVFLQKKKEIIAQLSNVRVLYWSLYERTLLHDITTRELELSKQQLLQEKARFELGESAELDTLSAAFEVLKAQQKKLSVETNTRMARNDLALALMTEPESIQRVDEQEMTIADLPARGTFIKRASEFDPQLKIFSLIRERLEHQYRKQFNELLPTLDFHTNYTYSISDSVFLASTTSTSNVLFKLIFSYSLPNKRTNIKRQQTKLESEQNNATKQRYEQELDNRVDELLYTWDKEKQKIKLMAATKHIAEKQLQAANEGYAQGSVDMLTKIKAKNDYIDAELDYLQAQIILKRLEIIFDEITGRLLSRFGIRIE